MTGHGGTESKENKKQEIDQTVLTTTNCLPKRLIVLVKPKKCRGGWQKILSGASRLTCTSQNKSDTKTKIWKNAMIAREPNSWPIRYHRTWTQELAVSYPSTIVHVGGGRSSPRNFWCFWYDELWNNRVNIYDKLSLIAQDILAAPASQVYIERGFSVCGLLTAGRRNRMTKLNKKVLADTGVNASVWTLEL